ncbi:hypothetical protein YB2330_000074 [Saitoella coloradoensis]
MAKDVAVLTRHDVAKCIGEGEVVVIYDNLVLKLNSWMSLHPGGEKSILHMVGRDATDEINAYHCEDTKKRMRAFIVGRVEGVWKSMVPPIQGGKYGEEDEGVVIDSSSASSKASDNGEEAQEQGLRPRASMLRADSGMPPTPAVNAMPSLPNPVQEAIEHDLASYPSLDPSTQQYIAHKYRELHERLEEEGYYDCNYAAYGRECIRYSILLAVALYTLHHAWYLTSALFLGLFWHQLTFVAHDAGHLGITHDYTLDNLIGILVADVIGGLSLGWWKLNHNVHHIVTNHPEHDPDIQHMPLFAVTAKLLEGVRSTYYDRVMEYDAAAKFFIQIQRYSYYPILCFGRFNLYRLSYDYLIMNRGPKKGKAVPFRYIEMFGICVFWYWFGYCLLGSVPTWGTRIAYILISHIVTMPLHVQITLSHFAMSTADLGLSESFPQRQLRTTMDVSCPAWLDFIHGGLQFQAVHHLFPRVPRHNLRAVQQLVKEFCGEVGIEFKEMDFVDGNRFVVGKLGEVSQQARILATVAKAFHGKDVHFH